MMLTKRQRDILEKMAAHQHHEDGEIVYERGVGYIGLTRISATTVFALVRLGAVSLADGSDVGEFERYTINGTGLYLIGKGPKPDGYDQFMKVLGES